MYSLQKYGVLPVFVLLGVIFFSCNRTNSPGKEVEDPVFRAVLVDAFLAEAYIQEEASYKRFNAASLMNYEIYPVILEKHQVDSASFIHTLDYYLHHPDQFREVLTQVQDSLNNILEKAPVSAMKPPPPPPEEITSDTILAQDAMNRYNLLEKVKNQAGAPGKKTN